VGLTIMHISKRRKLLDEDFQTTTNLRKSNKRHIISHAFVLFGSGLIRTRGPLLTKTVFELQPVKTGDL
jgi:hypothetical protein